MKYKRLKLEGLTHIYPEVFEDERGHFFETYKQETFTDIVGEEISFVQDNQSYSHNGVIRGLHYQLSPFQQCKLFGPYTFANLKITISKPKLAEKALQ